MKRNFPIGSTGMVLGLVSAVACAGTRLHDVGDIDGEGGVPGSGATSPGGKASVAGDGPGSGGELPLEGGTGGTAGTGPVSEPPLGGVGGVPEDDIFLCDACEVVAETPDILDLWVQGEHVYWVEHGSFDDLGNYLNDGRLMTMPVGGGDITEIVGDLQGPVQLAVSDSHAYVLIERSSSLEGPMHLVRVALETGQQQALQAFPDGFDTLHRRRDWPRRFFAAGGDYAFWLKGTTVYRLAEDATTAPEALFEAEELLRLQADDSKLYTQDAEGIESLSHDGDTSTPLWVGESERFEPLTLTGSNFYGVEFDLENDGYYLVRLPVAGGAFTRVGTAPAYWVTRLHTDGTSFIGDFGAHHPTERYGSVSALWEGAIAASEDARIVAQASPWDDGMSHNAPDHLQWRAWDATATTIYLGHEDTLYSVARD